MQQELSDKEYFDIVEKLVKLIKMYKKEEIDQDQVIEKVFGYFFINKSQ